MGVDDEVQGERLVAVVALRKNVDAVGDKKATAAGCISQNNASHILSAFLKTRLAAYKVPRIVIVVDEIPRNHLGKVRLLSIRVSYTAAATIM